VRRRLCGLNACGAESRLPRRLAVDAAVAMLARDALPAWAQRL
jgi:hypothetical protein